MPPLDDLRAEVESARERIVEAVGPLSTKQGAFAPNADSWSIAQVVEHLVLAEEAGINGMWKAVVGMREGAPVWEGELVHRGRSIEEVVAKTWRPKEAAPAVAAPSWGGPLAYWLTRLQNCRLLLAALGTELADIDLEAVVYPHPISGPLDARQRLEFLRFHLDRHLGQIERLLRHAQFPSAQCAR